MSKILAIDYGDRRTGLAMSDATKTIATSFGVIEKKDVEDVVDEITKVCDNNDVKEIIIGNPISLKGEKTVQSEKTEILVGVLKNKIDVPVQLVDERLSSKMAIGHLSKIKKVRKNEGQVDIGAAKVILQDYLDKINN